MSDIILVDENDNQIGIMEKIEAHEKGLLHRCFSIFILNSKGEMMLQKRADGKYHCGGLWTNTCCSHPKPNEGNKEAAHRRLKEEMGFDCELKEIFNFTYYKKFDNGLIEHEFDHVFIGNYDGDPELNSDEVSDWQWVSPKYLDKDTDSNPNKYTYWFVLAYKRVFQNN